MNHSVCFIGHRKINDTPDLRERVQGILVELIEGGTVTFIFGDHSVFDSLCYELVTELKEKHPEIKRIHYRINYEEPDEYTAQYLTAGYEESICPPGVGRAGRAGYTERNRAMIRESDICVFYYDTAYLPARRKHSRRDSSDYQPSSGTALAFHYAQNLKKPVINCFDCG